MNIAIFYGSTTCYTEMTAEKLKVLLESDPALPPHSSVSLHNIKQQPLQTMQQFDVLILGISTWDFGELQEDWEAHWDEIASVDLQGKIVAIFGMGDQIGYTEWFVDAMGMLNDAIAEQHCQRIGYWSTDGYQFDKSKATTADGEWFVGLALDEENQYDQTDERLIRWSQQLLGEITELS